MINQKGKEHLLLVILPPIIWTPCLLLQRMFKDQFVPMKRATLLPQHFYFLEPSLFGGFSLGWNSSVGFGLR